MLECLQLRYGKGGPPGRPPPEFHPVRFYVPSVLYVDFCVFRFCGFVVKKTSPVKNHSSNELGRTIKKSLKKG
jgi:hypothetical protein